ncbi:DinB family protein [Kribbella sp. NPDC051718]|uniref:DinB family protein n=1 Tax=Kribbella sp. NPDC051718 TaxID=3155168 RepID=UPI0034225416
MTEDALVLEDVQLRGAFLRKVRLIGAELCDVEITGDIQNLTVNGVEVAGLIEAELDRRDPDRPKMRPTDSDGVRAAWELLEQRWGETVAKARALPPELLHESVDGEWSFIETLRHLSFATDAWIRRVILGDPTPWHPLDLPWDEMADTPGIPRDRAARPSLDEALALREDRMAGLRQYVDQLTDEQLAGDTTPISTSQGWPRPISYPVREVLLLLLNEEYMHRLYAERDLAVLAAR